MIEIKVALVINKFETKKINSKYRHLTIDLWEQIKESLIKKKKYKFKETFIDILNYQKIIDQINLGKYDIGIGDFYITKNKLQKVNFTIPFMIVSPVLIYHKDQIRTNQIDYFKYLIKVWKTPALVLLIAMMFCFFIIYKTDPSKNILDKIYYSFGIFMNKTNIESRKNLKTISALFLGILIYIISYFVSVYINALTTARSVGYLSEHSKLEHTIEDEKILVKKGSIHGNLILKNKGIPVFYTNKGNDLNPFLYFMNNREEKKLSGFIYGGLTKIKGEAKKHGLKVSQISFGNYKVGFPINKNKKELLKEINSIIQDLDDNNSIYDICNIWGDNNYSKC